MNGLDKIIGKIKASGEAEAAELISKAELEAAEIKKNASAAAAELMANAAAASDAECEAIRARAISGAASAKRSALLAVKASAVDEAYKTALDALVRLPEEAYRELMADLLIDALSERVRSWAQLDELYGDDEEPQKSAEVIMNAADRGNIGTAVVREVRRRAAENGGEALSEAAKQLKLSEKSAAIEGGFILVTGDIETNCSLSLLVNRLRDSLDAEVYGVLFPKKTDAAPRKSGASQ